MRSSAKYIWVFIVACFVVGFLIYESSGLFGNAPITPTTAVATVNGEDILYTTWQRAITNLEQQETRTSGRSLSLDERKALEERAYEELVSETLLQQEIRRRKLFVTDDEIIQATKFSPPPQVMQAPELQTDGQFDYEKYLRFLNSPSAAQSGMLQQLEAYYRGEIPKQKLYMQVASGAYLSDAQLWQNYRDARDSVQLSYAVFRPNMSEKNDVTVSDAEIRAYYDAHKDELERKGSAMVTFAEIVRPITAADSAATRSRLMEIRTRILAGEKFEELAKSESADTTSAANGGYLGEGPVGRFVKPFEAAANALKPGELSQPVLTPFGYHLIRLDSRKGDTLELRHILLQVTQSDAEASKTDRKADSLARMAASADDPAKFDAAIAKLGLTPFKAVVNEGEPLMYEGRYVPSVGAWAFSGPKVGAVSDLFDSEEGYFIARLESVMPGGVPPLEKVKDEIREKLLWDKRLEKTVDVAQKFATAAIASSLEKAGEILNTPINQTELFSRVSSVQGLGRANAVVGGAFGVPVGAISAPIKTEEGVFVIRVDRRIDADKAKYELEKKMMRQQAMQSIQRAHVEAFLANLRESAKIKDRRKEIQETVYQQGDAN